MLFRRSDQAHEQRTGLVGAAFEFGRKLNAHIKTFKIFTGDFDVFFRCRMNGRRRNGFALLIIIPIFMRFTYASAVFLSDFDLKFV